MRGPVSTSPGPPHSLGLSSWDSVWVEGMCRAEVAGWCLRWSQGQKLQHNLGGQRWGVASGQGGLPTFQGAGLPVLPKRAAVCAETVCSCPSPSGISSLVIFALVPPAPAAPGHLGSARFPSEELKGKGAGEARSVQCLQGPRWQRLALTSRPSARGV